MANVLTALRLLLVVPFAFFMTKGDVRFAVFALVVWVVALITDFLDGPIARRRGTVTALSGTFDHTTDFLFVTSGLSAGAFRGVFPWILPVLIVAAFSQYVIDSYSTGHTLAAAVAYDFGLDVGLEYVGIHGPAPDAQQTTRTSPDSRAGEIAGRLRR